MLPEEDDFLWLCMITHAFYAFYALHSHERSATVMACSG